MKRSDIPDLLVWEAAWRWRHEDGMCVGSYLAGELNIPPRLVVAKIEHMVSRGLLDYGVSPWCAWPERKP